MSCGDPGCPAVEDEIGGLDEFAHDGDDGDLGGFSSGGEALCEGPEVRIASLGGKGGEVEHAPGPGATAADEAQAPVLTAIAIVGGDAEEAGGLAPVHAPELGHADDQGGGDDG